MKTRFVLIGYGWRADFFYRIATALPEQFELVASVLRTKERAEEVRKKRGVFATEKLEEALSLHPDFVVLCVPRQIVEEYLEVLMRKNIPVLCETPPAKNTEELQQLWKANERYHGRIQIIEQYFLHPLYKSWLQVMDTGLIGEVSNVTLSALHGYHAVSMIRKFLGIQYEDCTIRGKKFSFPVTKTNSRTGFDYSGEVMQTQRELISLEFENGKVGFYDFDGEQYFSLIRTRRLNIQGVRGEINDLSIRYLNNQNIGVEQELRRIDLGTYNNSNWSHQGIILGSKFVYENPFPFARLNDDEIAVADCLSRMKEYVTTGKSFYSLKEALQDTYLSFLMEEAVNSGKMIQSKPQVWNQ